MFLNEEASGFWCDFFVAVANFILLLTLRKIQINFSSFPLSPLPSTLVPHNPGIPKPAKYLQPVKQSILFH